MDVVGRIFLTLDRVVSTITGHLASGVSEMFCAEDG